METRTLVERFPEHNVAYFESLSDCELLVEMKAAHVAYGAHMTRNGGLSTREHRIESILRARERFVAANGGLSR